MHPMHRDLVAAPAVGCSAYSLLFVILLVFFSPPPPPGLFITSLAAHPPNPKYSHKQEPKILGFTISWPIVLVVHILLALPNLETPSVAATYGAPPPVSLPLPTGHQKRHPDN